MIKYEKIVDELTSSETIVRTNEDGSKTFFGLDPFNSDYQAYLDSEAEQSTPNLS